MKVVPVLVDGQGLDSVVNAPANVRVDKVRAAGPLPPEVARPWKSDGADRILYGTSLDSDVGVQKPVFQLLTAAI